MESKIDEEVLDHMEHLKNNRVAQLTAEQLHSMPIDRLIDLVLSLQVGLELSRKVIEVSLDALIKTGYFNTNKKVH